MLDEKNIRNIQVVEGDEQRSKQYLDHEVRSVAPFEQVFVAKIIVHKDVVEHHAFNDKLEI